jgi:hypothetical protein
VIVYGLADPDGGDVRYIGLSTRTLPVRYAEHLAHAADPRKRHTAKQRWLGALLDHGQVPEAAVLEQLPAGATPAELCAAERRWIAYARAAGANLVNGTDGGELGGHHAPRSPALAAAAAMSFGRLMRRRQQRHTRRRRAA